MIGVYARIHPPNFVSEAILFILALTIVAGILNGIGLYLFPWVIIPMVVLIPIQYKRFKRFRDLLSAYKLGVIAECRLSGIVCTSKILGYMIDPEYIFGYSVDDKIYTFRYITSHNLKSQEGMTFTMYYLKENPRKVIIPSIYGLPIMDQGAFYILAINVYSYT